MRLRYAPALAIALSKLNFIDANKAVLAGKSTLNRLEYCPETIIDQASSRYHRIEQEAKELEQAFVDIFKDIPLQATATNYSGHGCNR